MLTTFSNDVLRARKQASKQALVNTWINLWVLQKKIYWIAIISLSRSLIHGISYVNWVGSQHLWEYAHRMKSLQPCTSLLFMLRHCTLQRKCSIIHNTGKLLRELFSVNIINHGD
jgi:hypothetical protein